VGQKGAAEQGAAYREIRMRSKLWRSCGHQWRECSRSAKEGVQGEPEIGVIAGLEEKMPTGKGGPPECRDSRLS